MHPDNFKLPSQYSKEHCGSRHQDLKSGGARILRRNDWLWGGAIHVRVAHIASAKRVLPIQNADPKRPFGQTCAAEHAHSALFAGYSSSASEARKPIIWRHLNVVIGDFALPGFHWRGAGFCSRAPDRKRHIFGRFEPPFWNDVYSKISMDATAFCSRATFENCWYLASKVKHDYVNPFWIGVLKRCWIANPRLWNAVCSYLSLDATAFCSNHVWKRWCWPQKLSINSPNVHCIYCTYSTPSANTCMSSLSIDKLFNSLLNKPNVISQHHYIE